MNHKKLDKNRDNEAVLSLNSIPLKGYYSKETFSVLDQIITDCKENWKSILEKVEPFTVLLPPWDKISEELAEELDQLFGGKVLSGSLVAVLVFQKRNALIRSC